MPPQQSVAWAPYPGSQTLFMTSPHFETLYEGTRGPGKTDALIMDFAQHVGQGWGPAWRGILFRQEYKPLAEVVVKTKKWFRKIFPAAQFKASHSDYKWVFPTGEELLLRPFKTPDDYWDYHGHEYPWIGWEELTAWSDLACYHVMKSCCRSTVPGMPRKYRATTNPYGKGHNAVKAYFIDPAPPGVAFEAPRVELPEGFEELATAGEALMTVRIRGHFSENKALMAAQPNYPRVLAQAATNPEQIKAWLAGDWDIVAGGMFDDVWSKRIVLPGWAPKQTPSSWTIERAFDWGSSRPFSVGWWAESDGTVAPDGRTYPRGTLFRIAEWYGWNGSANTGLRMSPALIAQGIVEREESWGVRSRVEPGPADTSIWDVDPGRESIGDEMANHGVRFMEADKKPGSRKRGWLKMRDMLQAASDIDNREDPALYVFESCRQFIRTIPTLPRDERDPDDVDTDAEDHVADETRYRVLNPDRRVYGRVFEVV